jgi:hypothetical protein
MTGLNVVNDLRTDLERIVNESLQMMLKSDAQTRFQLRDDIKTLAFVSNKLALISHTMVDKINDATTDASVGKDVSIRIRHAHKTSSYVPDVDGAEMMYILRKRLQHLVRYEFDLARKWIIDFNLPQRFEECMNVIDTYMIFAEKLQLLSECDIEHTRAVQNACRKGNFSLNEIRYHLRGL